MTLIRAVSAQMHGERARESEVIVDSTVQEKNVTYPQTPSSIAKSSSDAGSLLIETQGVCGGVTARRFGRA